jgi:hypothetical protein
MGGRPAPTEYNWEFINAVKKVPLAARAYEAELKKDVLAVLTTLGPTACDLENVFDTLVHKAINTPALKKLEAVLLEQSAIAFQAVKRAAVEKPVKRAARKARAPSAPRACQKTVPLAEANRGALRDNLQRALVYMDKGGSARLPSRANVSPETRERIILANQKARLEKQRVEKENAREISVRESILVQQDDFIHGMDLGGELSDLKAMGEDFDSYLENMFK